MGRFFNRERFGNAQIAAGLLLLIFMAQCLWLIAHERPLMSDLADLQFSPVEEGLAQWHGRGVAGTPAMADEPGNPPGPVRSKFDTRHSPLWYLIASAPLLIVRGSADSWLWLWLTRAPYVIFGTLLGGSLWYVSRRLYGNSGGFIALGLYCFSPTVIRASSLWYFPRDIGAVWGLFGAVFTAIAVSHTLYAPREVVLWNWRRTVLLGVSLALAIGSQFQLAVILPLLVLFMLYLAPDRKAAAVAILAAADILALVLLFCAYFFHAALFWRSLGQAKFLDLTWQALAMPGAYTQVIREAAAAGPVLVLLIPLAIAAYLRWPRSRYFGNTAPLLVAILFITLRIGSPHAGDSALSLSAVVFLFVFVAGMAADLVETQTGEWAGAVIVGLLGANAVWNLIGLAKIA